MPQVAVAAVAAAAGSAIAGTTVAGSILIGAVVNGAIAGGLTLVSMALAPKPKGLKETGRTLNLREPTSARRIIYGRTRVGGVVLFAESVDQDGQENGQLQMFYGYTGHEVDGFEAHFFDDTELALNDQGEVTTPKYLSNGQYIAAGIHPYVGSPTQRVGIGTPSWGASDRMRGIAGVHCQFNFSTSAFPNGVPTVNSIVRGRRVYDPRTGVTAWSDNAALCIRDYLTDPVYGLGATAAELDEASFVAGANICDETVMKADGTAEKRYTLNGVIETDQQPVDILRSMLTACGGTLVYTGGVWRLYVAAAQTATVTLDEHDIIGRMRVQARRSKRDLVNRVRGLYVSPVNQYQPADFPPVVNAMYRAQDGGEDIWGDIDLPFTDSPSMAQRLAKITLEKNRQQITVECRCKLTAFRLAAGLWVKLSNKRRGWDRKLFEVTRWQLVQDMDEAGNPMLAIDLTLQETAPGIFDWDNGEETTVDLAPDTNLPDPWTVAPPAGLTLSSSADDVLMMADGTAVSRIRVEIESAIDAGISRYEVQYKRSGGSIWIDAAPLTGGNVGYIAPVQEGIGYDVRVRAVSILGVPSAWVVSSDIQAGADTTPPAAPAGLTATPGFRQITLEWTNPPASSDLAYVEIWEAASNNRAAAVRVGDARGTVFLRSGLGVDVTRWYWARAVDRSGNVGPWNAGATAGVSATTLFVDADDFSEGVIDLFEEAGAYGIEPVAILPPAGGFDGEIVYLRADKKLYRWDATAAAWTTEIYAGLAPGSVGAAAFAQSVRPVEVLSALPGSGNFEGRIVYLTTDDKLYRYTGSAWTAAVPAADLSGQITGTQISDGAISTPKLAAGAVTANELAANAVTAGKIAAGAVSADQIAVNAITAGKIAAGAVTTDKIAANSITAGLLAASGVITNTAQITDGIITNAKIASVAADKLRAGYIDTLNLDLRAGSIRVWDSNNNRIRVQIGHIPGYDYGFLVNAQNGDVMFDAGGINGVYIHNLTVDTIKVKNGAITNVAGAAGDSVSLHFPHGGVAELFYVAQGTGQVVGTSGGEQVYLLSRTATLHLNGQAVASQQVVVERVGSQVYAPFVLRWIGAVGIGTHTATVTIAGGAGTLSGKTLTITESRR